jgi:hypothetical protein
VRAKKPALIHNVFAVLLVAVVIIAVVLASLPAAMARKRGHRQAGALYVTRVLGMAGTPPATKGQQSTLSWKGAQKREA